MRKGVLLSLLASDLRSGVSCFRRLYICVIQTSHTSCQQNRCHAIHAYSDQSEAWMSRRQPMRGQQSLGPWLAITRHSCRYCSHHRDIQGWDNKVTLFRLKPEKLLLCCCLLRKCETGQTALNGLCEFIYRPRLMSR